MIDLRTLRDSPEATGAILGRRLAGLEGRLDRVRELDEARRANLKRGEALKAQRNRESEEVGRRKKAGEDAAPLLAQLKHTSESIKQLDRELRGIETQLDELLLQIPNLPLEEIPDGDEAANEVLDTWGSVSRLNFDPKPHWDLGAELGIIDLPRGAKISGSGFPLFVGAGAKLVRALRNFMLDLHTAEHGYTEVAPPHLVLEDAARGTGQLPDLENNMYRTEDGLYLIPTAEIPVTNLHAGEIIPVGELPRAYVAYTPCYRREAGAHGKDTRGVIRVHQFDKVELVRICRPSDSPAEFKLLLDHATRVLQLLEIPYRVVVLAAGDLGFASAKTYDLEVWAAGSGRWLEASSVSTFTDFQARRGNIRYRPEAGSKPQFCHTLNASGVAIPRTLIALVENNQNADGSVNIPEALQPYFGGDRLTGAAT